jgi:branched-chain amino acid transport system ATP-binding protein
MLQLTNIEAAYGTSQVLFGIGLAVKERQLVGLLGRNGMGKTTVVRTIMGILRPLAGTIEFDQRPLQGLSPDVIARAGIGLVPEGRQIFPNLTVVENLQVAAANRHGESNPWNVSRVFSLFPSLAERRFNLGDRLSGGEQQMLAIGRALMTNPRLLILDEATEGLSPLLRGEIWKTLSLLKQSSSLAILLIDKNIKALSRVADWHYILEKGRIVWTGDSADLLRDTHAQRVYLGI